MKNKESLSALEYITIAMLPPIIVEISIASGLQRSFVLYLISYTVITVVALLYIKYKKSKSD
jgi:hypothetical protein